MKTSPITNKALFTGALLVGIAVLIGAFGAHGLKALVSPQKLETFETGVRYHFYHGLGLMVLGLFSALFPKAKTHLTYYAFMVGILLFSFNCYLYVLTDIKVFAIIVPVGGLLFVMGWFAFAWTIVKSEGP
jgi:uncharacterized membrane protein YgdD (TMEM256/DUF423 family)